MVAATTQIGSNPIVAVIVAAVVLLVGSRVAKHVAKVERDPKYVKILMWSLVLHLLCAPAQIWVVDHFYNGIADYTGYVDRGASLAQNLRAGHFTFAGTRINGYTEDNVVYIASGVVQTIIGVNKLALFLFFTGVSFFGDVAFFRAFCVTFPEASHRRYAYLLLFLPSLLFWTADVSKETVMTFALGICAYGAARILMRARGGFLLFVLGGAIGLLLRPNEVVLLVAGLAVAIFFRGRDPRKKLRGIRRITTFLFVGAALALAAVLTEKLLKSSVSLSQTLQNIGHNNSAGSGAGYGSSNVPYSSNPLLYPRDLYTVMFDPLPITAHGKSELLAGLENTVIVVIILMSIRQIRCFFRAALLRPYVLLCAIYSILFIYVFAALGNLGLIYRERTLLLPFLLVIFAIPVSPKGKPRRFLWEKKLQRRRQRRQSSVRGSEGLSRATTGR